MRLVHFLVSVAAAVSAFKHGEEVEITGVTYVLIDEGDGIFATIPKDDLRPNRK